MDSLIKNAVDVSSTNCQILIEGHKSKRVLEETKRIRGDKWLLHEV